MAVFQDPNNGTLASIKPASTAPVATDTAIVVALSPNTPSTLFKLTDGVTTPTVDPTAKALRVSTRPWEVVGSYSMALESGAMTIVAANGPVWSMRYTGAGLLVPLRLSLVWVATTAFTTAQIVDHALFVARSFSASDSAGTAATLTGNNGKYRTSHATTGVGDMRIGSTGAITAGTRTLDAQAAAVTAYWGAGAGSNNSGAGPAGGNMLYDFHNNVSPIVLANNEGLVIQNVTVMGAAGVIKLIVNVEWVELASGAL